MTKNKLKQLQESNDRRNKFLNSFFENDSGYAEKEVNGFHLVRQGGERLIIAIYEQEAFKRYKQYAKPN